MNEEGYQKFSLVDLHESFGNPIVIDKTQVLDLWNKISLGVSLVATIGLFIWNLFVKLAYLALIGLLVWGGVSIKRQGVNFSLILITGIYANVPTLYLTFLLKKIGIGFFSFYTILLIIIWAVALHIVLKAEDVGLAMINSEIVSSINPKSQMIGNEQLGKLE